MQVALPRGVIVYLLVVQGTLKQVVLSWLEKEILEYGTKKKYYRKLSNNEALCERWLEKEWE